MTPGNKVEGREILTVEAAAEYLWFGRSTAYELIRTRQVRSSKVGRLKRGRRDDADRFIDEFVAIGSAR